MTDNDQSQRHPVVRDILDQVHSGGLDTTAALHELHEVLLKRKDSREQNSFASFAELAENYNEAWEIRANKENNFLSYDISPNRNDDSNSRIESPDMNHSSSAVSNSLFPLSNSDALSDTRSQRIAHQESLIRQEVFKECTFRPQIKALPSYYGSQKDQDTPFLQRVVKWQKDKELDANKRNTTSKEHELEGCTFRPKINTLSIRSVKMTRGDTKESANIRLFKSAEISTSQKHKLFEEELRIEKEKELSECTFRPSLNTNAGKFKDVGTKYDRVVVKVPIATTNNMLEKEKKECTFTPKINGVYSNMPGAKLYVSTNVVDRLSRPPSAPNTPLRSGAATRYSRDDLDVSSRSASRRGNNQQKEAPDSRPVMDVASFMGSLTAVATNNSDESKNNDNDNDNSLNQVAKPNTEVRSLNSMIGGSSTYETPSRVRPRSAPRERTTESKADGASEVSSDPKFSDFMDRQNLYVKKREQHVKETEVKMTPGFKPKLVVKDHNLYAATDSSIHQSKENISLQGEFLDRVERDVVRRSEKEKTKSQQALSQHTFKPEIVTKKQDSLPSRSAYEMSKQDAMKKETNHRIIKLQVDKEKMKDATFKPDITSIAKKTSSKLSLRDDPSKVLEMHREQQNKLEEKRQEELNRRALKEMEACTFAPQTTDCPEYIKRIAKSMSVVRQARNNGLSLNQSSGMEKTEWR